MVDDETSPGASVTTPLISNNAVETARDKSPIVVLLLLGMCSLAALFSDSNSVLLLDLLTAPCLLSFVSATSRNHSLVGLLPIILCRSFAVKAYFQNGISFLVAYLLSFVAVTVLLLPIWGAARQQKRAWSYTNSCCSTLVFPILVTAFFQLVFVYSPVGTVGNPAMALAQVAGIRQCASLVGEIGLVFWIGWLAAVVAQRLGPSHQRPTNYSFYGISTTLLLYGSIRESQGLFMMSIQRWPLSQAPSLQVSCLVRANDSVTMVERTYDRLMAGDDLVLWSEFAVNHRISSLDWPNATSSGSSSHNVGAVVATTYGELLIAAGESNQNKTYNTMELLQNGTSLGRYEKNRPVPVIESDVEPGKVSPMAHAVTFTPLSRDHGARKNLTLQIATAICFDFDFPDVIRHAKDADLVFGPSWYWESIGWHLWGDNIFRAIENGFTLIKCAEDGISGAVDLYGRTIAARPTLHDSVYVMEVPVQIGGARTVYSNGGFMFGWICVLFAPILVYIVSCRNVPAADDDEFVSGETEDLIEEDYQNMSTDELADDER